jgi:hypothetical protein
VLIPGLGALAASPVGFGALEDTLAAFLGCLGIRSLFLLTPGLVI